MSNEIAKRSRADLATLDYGDHAGQGFEGQTADDIQIPMIALLQSLSPQVDEEDEKYIPGAKPGLMFNTVTNELYGEDVNIIPCFRERSIMEWVDRKHGGGLVGRHDKDSDLYRRSVEKAGTRFGKIESADDEHNILVDTVYIYVIIEKPDGTFEQAVLPFKSTGLSVYRKWNTRINSFTVNGNKPPLFAHRVTLGVARQENSKGKFYNFTMSPSIKSDDEEVSDMEVSLLAPDDSRFKAALALRELVKSGAATADVGSEDAADGDADDDGGGAF